VNGVGGTELGPLSRLKVNALEVTIIGFRRAELAASAFLSID